MEKFNVNLLQEKILQTLQAPFLRIEHVIESCDRLSGKIKGGEYDELIERMGLREYITKAQLAKAADLLDKNNLLKKVQTELGKDQDRSYPLGVLLHIGAGNTAGLAAYSIIEGLLTRNINLVKLPSNDNGISAFILNELIKIYPLLHEYIYLFELSSDDKAVMKELAALADAIIVWGGDEAVQAFRAIAGPNQKIIEWGHKLSFAYITPVGINDENMIQLAEHIIKTRQGLCSSCQGIYLDITDEKAIHSFCNKFIKILEDAAKRDSGYDIGLVAQSTLRRYTYFLEHPKENRTVFEGAGVNLFYLKNSDLEAAMQHNNIWVKSLPRTDLIRQLKRYHGYLQTVGLMCGAEERCELTDLMIRAGVTNIKSAGNMSDIYQGESHDGEYPLRRYSKILNLLTPRL